VNFAAPLWTLRLKRKTLFINKYNVKLRMTRPLSCHNYFECKPESCIFAPGKSYTTSSC